jgi:nicotinate-nucleotide--dimethylbenzimidazole phosphoribosyltransferase
MSRLDLTIAAVGPRDASSEALARRRLDRLTKPPGSLGRLEEIAVRLAGIQRRERPTLSRKVIYTLAADHGVAAQGVSAYPREVTGQMVLNFLRGGAAINVLSRLAGAALVVADFGVVSAPPTHPSLRACRIGPGTRDMTDEPAMTAAQAREAIEAGIGLVGESDVAGTGEMGIGNTTAASALTAVLAGAPVDRVTGRGTGIDDARRALKVRLIERALERHAPRAADPLGVLAAVGGFEIAGLAGVILGAAARRIPVVLDGFIATSAALVAAGLCPEVKGSLFAAHRSAEPGHRIALEHLGLEPLLDLSMRLGEGTGSALGLLLLEAACRICREMATFEDAGVSGIAEGTEG